MNPDFHKLAQLPQNIQVDTRKSQMVGFVAINNGVNFSVTQTIYIDWYETKTSHTQGFPKVDHSGRSERIVLEQINSAKKNPSSNRN